MVFQPASEYEKALASASGLSRALKKPVAERSLWDALTQPQPQPRTLLHALTGLPDQWDRATLLPMETNRQTGERRMAAPQAAMDLLSALMLPGDVAQGKVNMGQPGQFSPEAMQAATNAAVNLGITGSVVPKPPNALNMGFKTLSEIENLANEKGVKLSVNEGGDALKLNAIVVPKELRGGGIGTEILNALAQYADTTGKTIATTPSTDLGGSSMSALMRFYQRFGFTPNKGKSKDFRFTETMKRDPR